MNNEISYLIEMYTRAYKGDPWFGRSIKKILAEINAEMASEKLNDQHSILELLYHMIIWREFTISRLKPEKNKTSRYFSVNNWQKLDHNDLTLWEKGLHQLEITQERLIDLLKNINEEKLTEQVAERKYDFRYLLNGILQHDIYHLGQIAYIKKMIDAF